MGTAGTDPAGAGADRPGPVGAGPAGAGPVGADWPGPAQAGPAGADPGGLLVESVPNFSEGRRGGVIEEIVAAFAGAHPDVLVLDCSSDPDHNRSVLTLAGPGPALVAAAVAGAVACARLIDLTRHRGAHPRMGALDVLPFVPLPGGGDLAACASLAVEAGRRLAEEVGIPVYLYGAAAWQPDRAQLPSVRGRGFEELLEAAARDPGRAPDLGGPAPHRSAGASAVGARPFLVAYNVNLATGDLAVSRRIARAVRERDGGLPAVRALGLALDRRGVTQVSMNLLDFRVTPPATAFAAVAELAARAGVEVIESEIVGLVPEAALAGADPASLGLRGFSPEQLLEQRLRRALVSRGSAGDLGGVAGDLGGVAGDLGGVAGSRGGPSARLARGFPQAAQERDTPSQRLEGGR
jgi:glutamate formiminotransferase